MKKQGQRVNTDANAGQYHARDPCVLGYGQSHKESMCIGTGPGERKELLPPFSFIRCAATEHWNQERFSAHARALNAAKFRHHRVIAAWRPVGCQNATANNSRAIFSIGKTLPTQPPNSFSPSSIFFPTRAHRICLLPRNFELHLHFSVCAKANGKHVYK